MFFNSVNSGDLLNVQNYFNTFMTGPCTFMVQHRLPSEIGIPSVIQAFSPNLFSHYLLGCFITFPDMVLKLGSSKVYSSLGRTRIVMETECFCTKIYDIPDYNWAPDVEELSGLYSNLNIGRIGDQTNYREGASSSVVSSSNNLRTPIIDRKGNTYATGPELKVEISPSRVRALQEVPVIPYAYLHAVVDRARLLPTPVQLHTKGTITLYIDEHNCMQHVAVDLAPQFTSSTTSSASYVLAGNEAGRSGVSGRARSVHTSSTATGAKKSKPTK